MVHLMPLSTVAQMDATCFGPVEKILDLWKPFKYRLQGSAIGVREGVDEGMNGKFSWLSHDD